ncbi:hypothetical protein OIO89_01330 (plasmid) [Mycobacterium ulcerans]|nr:hypothetical protein OIO89_01330 [Mycobacterium ulcerans]
MDWQSVFDGRSTQTVNLPTTPSSGNGSGSTPTVSVKAIPPVNHRPRTLNPVLEAVERKTLMA